MITGPTAADYEKYDCAEADAYCWRKSFTGICVEDIEREDTDNYIVVGSEVGVYNKFE
ncbi:hypothetical protein [Lachnoclostridium phytofermentans]|uniref:hypothetical protein n=1 Tax=Lachnoclostridium phytofermentans TaxID=66219 RepID=UPI000B1EC28A|nr:hypothetical protein [Lachnoclostridium phytofermentans]